MRVVSYVVAILVLAACGSTSIAAHQSPATSPSAAASPSSSPVATPSAPPSPSAAPVTPYGVLVTQGSSDTYSVTLVGADGKIVATASPSSPTQMTCGDAAGALLPLPVSTSDTRVYFLDAQGSVHFLTPNGETGVATRVPTGGQTRSMFAVSPDDQRIAVIEDTYTASGATTLLYVEDLNGATNHLKLFSETGSYTLWPIGWHGANNLVVAKVPSCTQGGGPTCCGPQELHVVDPATGFRRFTLGGPTCIPVGNSSPGGVLCENSDFTQARVLSWTGATLKSISIEGPTPAYLSPDGTAIALDTQSQTTFAGAKQTLDLVACGWIDATHVIAGGDTQEQARVGDITSGNIVPVAAQGTCGGRIPGGL